MAAIYCYFMVQENICNTHQIVYVTVPAKVSMDLGHSEINPICVAKSFSKIRKILQYVFLSQNVKMLLQKA